MKINTLEFVNGKMQAVTREMTEEEYAEYLQMQAMGEEL